MREVSPDSAGRIILSEDMRNAVDKAEQSLMAGECLTEDDLKSVSQNIILIVDIYSCQTNPEVRMFKKQ